MNFKFHFYKESIMKYFLLLICLLSLQYPLFADDDPTGPLRETDIRQMLSWQGLNADSIDQIIALLKNNPLDGSGEQGELKLSAALFSHGLNGAFFIDNDNWNMNAVFSYENQMVEVKNFFDVYYYNGGLNLELVYKWFWVFIPENININDLDGTIFGGKVVGRGLALGLPLQFGINSRTLPFDIAFEGGWVAHNSIGSAFILTAKIGLTVGEYLTSFGGRLVKKKRKKLPKEGANITIGRNNRYKHIGTGLIVGSPSITFPKLVFRQKKILPRR